MAEILQFANDSTFMHTDMQMEQSRSVSSFKLPYNNENEKCVVAIFASNFPATVVCNVFSARPEVFTIDSVGATKVVLQVNNNKEKYNFLSCFFFRQ